MNAPCAGGHMPSWPAFRPSLIRARRGPTEVAQRDRGLSAGNSDWLRLDWKFAESRTQLVCYVLKLLVVLFRVASMEEGVSLLCCTIMTALPHFFWASDCVFSRLLISPYCWNLCSVVGKLLDMCCQSLTTSPSGGRLDMWQGLWVALCYLVGTLAKVEAWPLLWQNPLVISEIWGAQGELPWLFGGQLNCSSPQVVLLGVRVKGEYRTCWGQPGMIHVKWIMLETGWLPLLQQGKGHRDLWSCPGHKIDCPCHLVLWTT